jgi:hypothetical protein
MHDMQALAGRIERLERQVFWWKRLAVFSFLGLTGLTAMAQIAPRGPHQAQGYALVDARGRTLAALSVDQGFPGLKLYDLDGRLMARFGLTPEGPSLRVLGPDGAAQEFLTTKPGVRPATE